MAAICAGGRGRLPALSAEAGFDGAASAFVALVDPRNQGVLAVRLAWQSLLQHLGDVAWRQQFQAWMVSNSTYDFCVKP